MKVAYTTALLGVLFASGCKSTSSPRKNTNSEPTLPTDSAESPNTGDVTKSRETSSSSTSSSSTSSNSPISKEFTFEFSQGSYTASVDSNGVISLQRALGIYESKFQLSTLGAGSALLANPTGYCEKVAVNVANAQNSILGARDLVRKFNSFTFTSSFFPVLSTEFESAMRKAAEKEVPGKPSYYWSNRPKLTSMTVKLILNDNSLYVQLGKDSTIETALSQRVANQNSMLSGAFGFDLSASDLVCDFVQKRASIKMQFSAFSETIESIVSGI